MPNQTHETNRSHNINLRVLSWMAIFAFVSVSAWYGFSMYRLFTALQLRETLALMCGNSVTDPLCFLLNFGAPTAEVGVVGIAFNIHRKHRRPWPAWLGGVLTLSVTVALILFGAWFFREGLGTSVLPLSSHVWWMGSVWRVIGK